MKPTRDTAAAKPKAAGPATEPPALVPGHWQHFVLDGGLGPHAAEWDKLNQSLCGSHPLLTSRFWNGLMAQFGHGKVVLWVLRDGDTAQAMCLLQRQEPGHWVSFLPSQAQVGPVLMRNDQVAEGLLHHLKPAAVQLDLLCVDPDLWPKSAQTGPLTSTHLHALTMGVQTDGDFDTYWAQRSGGLRQNLRRYERRAEAEGMHFELRTLTDPADMAAAVTRYAELESRGWKASQGTALTVGGTQSAFYTELLSAPGAESQGVVHELWHGEQLAASRLALQGSGMRVMLKTSYDETLSQAAPGQMLLKAALQHAFADPAVNRVEFYTNASVDQLAWATQDRWMRHLTLTAPTAVGYLWRGAKSLRQILAARSESAEDATLQITSLAMDDTWPSDVKQLLDAAGATSLEATGPWFQNLWQHVFKDRMDARLWVLRSTHRVLAVIPVLVDGNAVNRRASAMTNYYTALYVPALAAQTTARQLACLFKHLKAHHAPLGQFSFEPLDPSADTSLHLQEALQLAGFVCHRYHRFSNWYLPTPGSYALYLKGRTANLRSTIKRKSRSLLELGGEVEIITKLADLDRALLAYWKVYTASWKQDEPYPAFVDDLATWVARNGGMRMGVVWLQGEPVAAQLWLVAAGKAEIFKVAYDEAHKELSPGTVLTAALLEHVIDRDAVTEVDFLIGDDAYKRFWMSHRRERWGLLAYNPLSCAGLLGLARLLMGRLVRRLQGRDRAAATP